MTAPRASPADPAFSSLQQPLQHLPDILLAGYGGGPALGTPPRIDSEPLVDEAYNLHVTTYHEGLWACMAANEVRKANGFSFKDFLKMCSFGCVRRSGVDFLFVFMARLLSRKSRLAG